MSTIPLPALHTAPIEQPASPLQMMGQMMQIKNAQQEQAQRQAMAPMQQQEAQQQVQAGAINLQQQQQQQQDQQTFRTAMQDPANKGKTLGDIADTLANKGGISMQGWQQMKKADIDQRTSLATLDEKGLANAAAAHKQTQELYNNALNMPDDQLAQNWPAIAQQYDSIPGNNKMPLDPNKPLTKDQLQQFGPMLSMHGAYLDEALGRQQKQTELQKSQGAMDPNSPLYAPSPAAVAMGTAPGAAQIQQGEVKQGAARAAADEQARLPGEMAIAKQRQALSQGDPNAAAQLLVNGDATLSELKARGSTPEFIAHTLQAAHLQSGGKYNAQEADAQFQVAKSPAQVQFFGSAKSLVDPGGTLDQLAKAAEKIPQNQFPVFNKLEDWTKEAAGSGPLAEYAARVLGVADDYSKVMGGGTGSDASRLSAANLVAAKLSKEGRDGAISGIRGSVNSQIAGRIGNNAILQRMYGSATAPSGGAQGQAQPGSGAAPQEGATKVNSHGDKIVFTGGQWQLTQ